MTAMVDVLYPSCQAKELLKNQGREHPLENFSYFCKICSKRFVSGRALGGHMRAHVPPSVPAYTFAETEFQKSKRPRVSDDKSMEEKVDEQGLERNGRNLMHALRRSPKRSWRFVDLDDSFLLGYGLDSSPIDSSLNCDLCGKEFSSWKGLIEHKNCHCEAHQDSGEDHIEESHKHETRDKEEPGSKTDSEIEIDHTSENSRKFDEWMKGKGFKRPRYAVQLNPPEQVVSATNNEEEDMAMCLVMLASGVNAAQAPQFQMGAADPELGDLKLPTKGFQLLESIKKKPKYKKIDGPTDLRDDEAKKGRYKCTTCSKVFLSYQALGGHRTSHNKVKGCFTQIGDENLKSIEEEITDEELNTGLDSQLSGNFHKPPAKERNKNFCVQARDETSTVEAVAFSGKKTLRVHGCSICHRVFASGQALGGHKRCHWGSTGASDTSSSNKETPMQQQMPARVELLDLNLPAPVDDDWEAEPVDDDCDAENLNTVDSDGASYAQTHSPPYLLSLLMGNHQEEGLFLYNTSSHVSKDDDADAKLGKDIGLDSKLGLVKDIGFGIPNEGTVMVAIVRKTLLILCN